MRRFALAVLAVPVALAGVLTVPAGGAVASTSPGCAYPPFIDQPTVSTQVFSPRNHDGYRDTTTLSVRLHAPGWVRFAVISGGTTLRQSREVLGGDETTQRWVWDGRDRDGEPVPDGTYRAVVRWRQQLAGCQGETRETAVTVDDTAPRFGTTFSSYTAFYPRRDDAFGPYRDHNVFVVAGISEVASVRVALYEHGAARPVSVHLLGTYRQAWRASWGWSGRHNGGLLSPAGRYDVRFRLRDVAGNLRWTPRVTFWLSHRHVVAHTVTRTLDGWDYASVFNNNGCDAGAVRGDTGRPPSAYERGLHILFHDCIDPQGRFSVTWAVPVPAAPVYDTFSPFVYGHAETDDGRGRPTLGMPFAVRNQRTDTVVPVGVTGTAEGRHPLDTVRLRQFVRQTHRFELSAWLTAADAEVGDRNFDVRNVGVTIRYGTLAW